MQENDLYWLAGIMEGEGYFGIQDRVSSSGRRTIQVSFRVGMAEWDVISKIKSIIGFEDIKIRHRLLPSGKDYYIYDIGGKRAIKLMEMIRPFMGMRRYDKITEILALWNEANLTKERRNET